MAFKAAAQVFWISPVVSNGVLLWGFQDVKTEISLGEPRLNVGKLGNRLGPCFSQIASYEKDDVGWGVIVMQLPVIGDDFASADRSSQSREHTL